MAIGVPEVDTVIREVDALKLVSQAKTPCHAISPSFEFTHSARLFRWQ